MGKQFRFIMNEEDSERLIQKVLETGKVYCKNSSREIVQIYSLPKTNWLHLYFVKNKYEDIIKFFEEAKYVDVVREPVLELRQTYVRAKTKEIQRGRIYLERTYYENEFLVYKDAELEKWYKELVKWIRNNLTCLETFANGKVTKEYVSESLIRYVEDGFKLIG